MTWSQLVLVLHLIGWEESPFVFKANHSARWSTNNAISIYYRHSVEKFLLLFKCISTLLSCTFSHLQIYIFWEALTRWQRTHTHFKLILLQAIDSEKYQWQFQHLHQVCLSRNRPSYILIGQLPTFLKSFEFPYSFQSARLLSHHESRWISKELLLKGN